MPSLDLARAFPCIDPECPGEGQPEQDGTVSYLACNRCGYEWGFVQERQPVACGAGVSLGAQVSEQPGPRPVLLPLPVLRRPDG